MCDIICQKSNDKQEQLDAAYKVYSLILSLIPWLLTWWLSNTVPFIYVQMSTKE